MSGSSPPPPPKQERMGANKGAFASRAEDVLQGLAEGNPQQVMALVVGVVVGLLTLAIIVWMKKRRTKGRTVIVAGTCEAGKTAMFARLVHGKPVETYTSAKENSGVYIPAAKAPLTVVDIPGHERLRSKYFDQFKSSARAIIYVVDSSTIQRQLRDTTEYLFNVLSDPVVFASRPPVLIACNKQDVGLAKGPSVIRRELEKELTLLRSTHARTLQGTDDVPVVDHMFLGREDNDFEFNDLPMKVDFCETICGDDEEGLESVQNWLVEVA